MSHNLQISPISNRDSEHRFGAFAFLVVFVQLMSPRIPYTSFDFSTLKTKFQQNFQIEKSNCRPIRPQFYVHSTSFYVQFDLNFTSNSISILRPITSQFYVQFDLKFTSNSISILRPIRPNFYVQFDLNFISYFCTQV